MHKRLVAGLSGLVTCLQSNFIGTNFRGLLFKLRRPRVFSSPFIFYWAHIDWLAPGYLMGAGNPTISGETETQVRVPASPGSPTVTLQLRDLLDTSPWSITGTSASAFKTVLPRAFFSSTNDALPAQLLKPEEHSSFLSSLLPDPV